MPKRYLPPSEHRYPPGAAFTGPQRHNMGMFRAMMGSKKPTKAERRHMDAVQSLDCIVCRLTGEGRTPAEIHHILDGNRRRGHMHVLPLCWAHHRGGADCEQYTSRHPYKTAFERRYGPEDWLEGRVEALLEREA